MVLKMNQAHRRFGETVDVCGTGAQATNGGARKICRLQSFLLRSTKISVHVGVDFGSRWCRVDFAFDQEY